MTGLNQSPGLSNSPRGALVSTPGRILHPETGRQPRWEAGGGGEAAGCGGGKAGGQGTRMGSQLCHLLPCDFPSLGLSSPTSAETDQTLESSRFLRARTACDLRDSGKAGKSPALLRLLSSEACDRRVRAWLPLCRAQEFIPRSAPALWSLIFPSWSE